MAFKTLIAFVVIGSLLFASQAQQPAPTEDPKYSETQLEVREANTYKYTISIEAAKDSKSVNIKVAGHEDRTDRKPKLNFRRFIDSSSSYYSNIFQVAAGVTPLTYTVKVADLKTETTACEAFPTDEDGAKTRYLCHLEIKTYTEESGNRLLVIVEIKANGDDVKKVKLIPLYDAQAPYISTSGYHAIGNQMSTFTWELNDQCKFPTTGSKFFDNKDWKIIARTADAKNQEWLNKKVPKFARLVQFRCYEIGNSFTKWARISGNTGALGTVEVDKASSLASQKFNCINFPTKFYNVLNQLNYTRNCSSSEIRVILSDEKETFFFPAITTNSRFTVERVPKVVSPKFCGTRCYIMIAAGVVLALILIIGLALYFKNKSSQQQSYEQSLAKPLTSEGSPYYELKQN